VHIGDAFEPNLEDFPVLLRVRPSLLPRRDGSYRGSVLPSSATQWLLSSAVVTNKASVRQKLSTSFVVNRSEKHGNQLLCGFCPLEMLIKVG
jgi:hypothetical protein